MDRNRLYRVSVIVNWQVIGADPKISSDGEYILYAVDNYSHTSSDAGNPKY